MAKSLLDALFWLGWGLLVGAGLTFLVLAIAENAHAGNCNGNRPTCVTVPYTCPAPGPVEVECDCSEVSRELDCASTSEVESATRALLQAIEVNCEEATCETTVPLMQKCHLKHDPHWKGMRVLACRSIYKAP